MTSRVLLDTHIVVRWLADPKRLSREQRRVLGELVRRREPAGVSAITLIELALLFTGGALRIKLTMDELFSEIETGPLFAILPITVDIAKEVFLLGAILRDPADRVIVATSRVHGLRLLTSDRRIIESNVISAIE